jgi:hypothetical protein
MVAAMVTIDSDAVIGDNMWLWRADHVAGGAIYCIFSPYSTIEKGY